MTRIFGLDIGTTSIGFAVIDHDAARASGKILRLGARIFPEARDPDGTPLNQQRRQKRMMRRQLRRRRERRRLLRDILHDAGLLPVFSKKKNSDWHRLMSQTVSGDGEIEVPIGEEHDPHKLRKRGLSEPLSAHQLGRALYHLAQLRHFKGRDLEDEDSEAPETAEDKEAKTNRDSTLQALKAEGTTLGAWLSKRGPRERRRGIHANRAVVAEEFEQLWAAQAQHHARLREDSFKAQVGEAIFAQRPVFWRKNTLGECRFMPDEPLCPKGAWLSQQRRMLEKLNNLALEGGNARPLDREERAAILAKLQTQASMTWSGVQTALKPLYKARGEAGAEKSLKFNLQNGGEAKLLGNPMEAKLAKIFAGDWETHPRKQEIRDALHTRLWNADYGEVGTQRVVIRGKAERDERRAAAAQSFIDDFGASPEQAAALRDLKFATGWEPYSTRALQAFLPHLDAGERFGSLLAAPEWEDWRNETFPDRDRPTGELLDRLPSPAARDERDRLAKIRNPTVVRTQNELRKVVNNLIALYGKPDLIRIEVARDVGRSKRDREELSKAIRKREGLRKKAFADLEANGIAQPARRDIEKWMLWKESAERCPYTGDQIGFDALFRENEYQVEHIWPRWRSFDDSFANKTLCHRDVNLEKSNRTPYEAFHGESDRWAAMKNRVSGMMASKGGPGMSRGKVRKFLAESIPDEFASRQLNDTGYAARQVMAQLKRLWPDVGPNAPVTVQAVTGRVTGQLRRLWGLNNILSDDGEKTRADHRHHAIDALTVACTDPGITNRLSRYWQAVDDPAARKPDLTPPWATIRADTDRAAEKIVVSHRVRKKVSGPLHKETVYGNTGEDVTTKTGTYRQFVTRKPVKSLTKGELAQIRDDTVRQIVADWVAARGGDPKKAFPPYPTMGDGGPEIRKVRLLTKQQLTLMAPVSTGYADLGSNHHIAIYRLPDGKVDYEVVSLFEASRRLARRESVISRDRSDGSEFVMSLAPGEAIEFPEGEKAGCWIVQGAWASGQVVLERATDAAHETTTRPMPGSILRDGARKVTVDPIGRIRRASD